MSKTLFRAVCKEKDFKGPWRPTQDEALKDASDHQDSNEHVVQIEVSQAVQIRSFITT